MSDESIASLIDWLLIEATRDDDLVRILTGLSERLVEEGLPLYRVSVGMPTIDPVVRGLSFVWRRDRAAIIETATHGEDGTASFERSPVYWMQSRDLTTHRWRLEADLPEGTPPLIHDLKAEGITEYSLHLARFSGTETALSGAAISFSTDRPGGFSNRERTCFGRFLPALGLVAHRFGLARTASETLAVYLGPRTGRRVLAGEIRRGQGQRLPAAILMADLSGFTMLSDREDAVHVVRWLDQHFEEIGSTIASHGGEVLKFIGDGLLAAFAAEDGVSPDEACARALAAAEAAIAENGKLNARRRVIGEPVLELDVALHFGEVVYGNVGASRRLDFTVIGPAVNETARLEPLCGQLGHRLLMSDTFATLCGRETADLGAWPLRGVLGERRVRGLPPPSPGEG